ncbi:MAG: PUR family DNA/RNA-binding protein [Muribaculaceae bacterium]|nr:PUR family DNA/RNA-binding protein [Muribaculaceae bacterium]
MGNPIYSETIRSESRRYFFDVNTDNNGRKYLTITERIHLTKPTSSKKEQCHRIMVFNTHFDQFVEMLEKVGNILKRD